MRVTDFRLPNICAVMVFFVLGLMAKPMLVTLPFVLLLLDYWPLGRMNSLAAADSPVARRRSIRSVLRFPCVLSSRKSRCCSWRPFLCAVTLWAQREASALEMQIRLVVANRQRPGFLRGLSRSALLPAGTGRALSPPGTRFAGLESGRRSGSAGRHLCRGTGLLAAVPVFARGLALVFGNAGAGDRVGAGRGAGDGRSLHVLAANRLVHCPGVGVGRRVSVITVSSLAVRRRRLHWSWWF